MLRNLLLILLMFFGTSQGRSQLGHSLAWGKAIGSASDEITRSIAVDAAGNVFTTGYFANTVDFDPGPGVFNLTSFGDLDIFITKFNASGAFVWAKQLGGPWKDYGRSIVADAAGNVYSAGSYQGTADFDPGTGVYNLTNPAAPFAYYNAYVSKLDANGNFVWAKQWGSTDNDVANAIALDASNNVYTTGYFYGTVDFDPGAAVFNIVSPGDDIFVSKLDVNGNFVWAKKFSSSTIYEEGLAITIDHLGNVITTGYFNGTVDFDPGTGVANLVSAYNEDGYISKLDASGNFIWAKQLSGFGTEKSNAIAKDPSGNIYITGQFSGITDFDPGVAVLNLTPVGGSDIFICKLTSQGNLSWVKQIGGTGGDLALGIAIDHIGNIYSTGSFFSTVDFDPGPGIFNLTTQPALTGNPYISKLDGAGNFIWAKNPAGYFFSVGEAITIDAYENIYATGTFSGTTDLDPGPGATTVTAVGGSDIYISKFSTSNEIIGNCFYDINGDGIQQSGETKLSTIVMKATRNGLLYYGISDSSGRYIIDADTGSYTVAPAVSPDYYSVSPATQSAAFGSSLGLRDTGNHFAFRPLLNVNDLVVTLSTASIGRPGRPIIYQLAYKNAGTTTLSGTVTLSHDSHMTVNNAVPAASTYVNPLMTWNYSNLKPLETRIINIELTIQTNTPLASFLQSVATVNPVTGDSTPVNNTSTLSQMVVYGLDPNDKTATPNGNISTSFVSGGNYLEYLIRFQNVGNDTAFNIIVRDTLSSNADVGSFQMIAASHPYSIRLQEQGIAEWTFNNILLPDSTTNELRSHGFIRYRIKPRNTLVVGDQVKNKASVYFDFNARVVTNETINTVTVVTAVGPGPAGFTAKVFPNPSRSVVYIQTSGRFDYWVYDMTGKLIKSAKSLFNEAQLNVAPFAKGIYLLQVKTKKGIQTYKFAVQ